MKRITYILISLLMLFAFCSKLSAELPELEREYQIYNKGKQIKFNIELKDKNNDNVYDFISIENDGKLIVETKLNLINGKTAGKLFPRDSRLSNIEQSKCDNSDNMFLSFGIYDFNSIHIAEFRYDCQDDEAYYDFNPEDSDNGKSEDNELSFKSDDLSFLGVGLSPNPAKTHINIVYDPEVVRGDITIRIVDDKGEKVFENKFDQRKIKKNSIKIDINSFKNGLYEVELETLELSLILNFLKR